jgi:pyridoxine kinase
LELKKMSQKIYGGCLDGRSPLKRVAAIHDLSCFGRCALTVIIPTLSAMGIQVIPVPTCLLSSHTGGFTDLHFEDLEPSMHKIAEHFDRLNLRFDAIYTGFLGSASQISAVRAFIDRFADENTLVFVDPVMGDDGELYSTYTPELMRGMSKLCHGADIITPNLTEACFLCENEYIDTADMCREELENFAAGLCDKLSALGAKKIVITGMPARDGELAVYGRDTESGDSCFYCFKRSPKNYPGTGDLFASVFLGSIMRGDGFDRAIHLAADFTHRVMDYSTEFDTPVRDGVAFERFLGELADAEGV